MKSETRPRERLIETAERLFYSQGFNATGINQILSESKVARASLYQHFGSKEKLALAYLQNSRENWFSAFETYLSEKTEPIDKIWGAFDFLSNNMIQNEF
ncbi:MAG: TetR/AcrR family transcriptional regulator, partial [Bacteroidota bacterium]